MQDETTSKLNPGPKQPLADTQTSAKTNDNQFYAPGQVLHEQPARKEETSGFPDQTIKDSPSPVSADLIVSATEPNQKKFNFKLLIGILVFITALVWIGVGILYSQNQNLKKENGLSSLPSNTETPTPTSTPEFSPEQISIKNGNIIRSYADGDEKVLINKSNFQSTGITGFARVFVSPDKTKICFESWAPAPEPALYFVDIDGSNVKEVSPNRKNCIWSKDSKKIIYKNELSSNKNIDIFLFDIEVEKETNLTSASASEGVTRKYEIVGLSADGSKVICSYQDTSPTSQETSGSCEIDLETGEISFPET